MNVPRAVIVVGLIAGLVVAGPALFLVSRDNGDEQPGREQLVLPPLVLPDQPLDLATARDGGIFPPEEPTMARDGKPISASKSTPRLPMADEQKRTFTVPLGGLDEWIVLNTLIFESTGQQREEELALWNPKTGQQKAVPGSRRNRDAGERDVEDGSGEWLLITLSPRTVPPGTPRDPLRLLIHHVHTGQTRPIAEMPQGAGIGGPSLSGGVVAWADTDLGPIGERRQRVRLYDIATDRGVTLVDVPYQERHFTFEPLELGGRSLAWTENQPGGGPELLYVVDLASGATTRYSVSSKYSLSLKGVSGDGRYLLWTNGLHTQFATDLQTGITVRYAEARQISAAKGYAGFSNEESSEPQTYRDPGGDGGLYDLQRGEVRQLAEREGCLCLTQGVMGDWFVWREATPIPKDDPRREPTPVGDLRFMRLP
jgi:hypothetical protein